jgi:two-component system NarL family sensor kinase
VLLTVTVLHDEKGAPVELAATERDITDQKRADRELRSLHASVIAVQETERKRMARDLHDGVGQILSGVKFRLDALSGKIDSKGGAAAQILEIGGLMGRAIAEIRLVSKNLMPSELEDLGLAPALHTLCRDFEKNGGVSVTLRTGPLPATITPELALAIFRIAQEALNNIGKHSRATMATVDLSCDGNEIILSVSDNGIGFTPGGERPPAGRGIGLGSMRERAESNGGRIEFDSKTGVGTTLCVHAPFLRPGETAI